MAEFDFIYQHLAPLTPDGLINDGAVIPSPPPGFELVITTDTLIEGCHFFGFEPPGYIARKALRVNLSDLAAMGASPVGYTLSLTFAAPPTSDFASAFAAGLKQDQTEFNCPLLGGDTTSQDHKLDHQTGKFTITITAIGAVPIGQALPRNGAQAGDNIYVTGTLGDAVKGLQTLEKAQTFINNTTTLPYLLPNPQLTMGQSLRGIATSCLDISDGLAGDAAHIANHSNLKLIIETHHVPGDWQHTGDDYQLLFTAPPEKNAAAQQLAAQHKVPLTKIGYSTNGCGVVFVDKHGNPLPTPVSFEHF